ncbi:MAG: 2-keto-3-deoxy-L-fuconate dehydrogenase [Saprospiraceae bacterium]|jgi:2-keto-3-deoxy-L-fuconate dehydrogenase
MKPLFNLKNRVAVITGGGSGIGEAIAKVFARQEAEICILDIHKENSEAVVEQIKAADGKAHFYECNIANHKEVAAVFEKIYQTHKRLDILVNNAGVAHIGNVEMTTEEDMDRVYKINVKGAFSCLQAAVTQMKKSGGGVILNLASVASVLGISDRFAYSMSKGAMLTMTYSVAKDYIRENIRCNAVGPGRVHTPFVDGFLEKNYPGQEAEMFEKLSKTQPIGRMAKPEEIASLALYLCSDEAGFVTGSFFPIDGGFMTLNS